MDSTGATPPAQTSGAKLPALSEGADSDNATVEYNGTFSDSEPQKNNQPPQSRRDSNSSGTSSSPSDDSSSVTSSESSGFDKYPDHSSKASEPRTWGSYERDPEDRSTLPPESISSGGTAQSLELEDLPFSVGQSVNMDHMPAPNTKSHLPCPFGWSGCSIKWDIRERRKWIFHSLDHFPRGVQPPKNLICTFEKCGESFSNPNGIVNWYNRMNHFANHIEEKVSAVRARQLWAENDDIDLEAQEFRDFSERIDINLRQYMVHHGVVNRLGLDIDINPNPPSERDRIPVHIANRMPEAFGGQRVREVLYGPLPEPDLEWGSGSAYSLQSFGRGRREMTAWSARTSGNPARTSQTLIPHFNDRRLPRGASGQVILR